MKKLEKIMYIEDEPDIIAIAEISLKEIGGFSLVSCQSGRDALQKALEFKPDIFLIDVMMPEMDGPTVLKAIRQTPELANTPVIFITAKTQSSEIKEYLKLGALEVITKPFDPLKLPDTIKEIWENYAK